MCVAPFHCRPKPEICHLKPVTCRLAQVSSRHGPVTNCCPEPPCVVTDIPKRELVDNFQVCSNYAPWAKNDPARGSHVLHRLISGKHKKIFLSETTRPRVLITVSNSGPSCFSSPKLSYCDKKCLMSSVGVNI